MFRCEAQPPKSIVPDTLDRLGFIYVLRLQSLKENSGIYLPATDVK